LIEKLGRRCELPATVVKGWPHLPEVELAAQGAAARARGRGSTARPQLAVNGAHCSPCAACSPSPEEGRRCRARRGGATARLAYCLLRSTPVPATRAKEGASSAHCSPIDTASCLPRMRDEVASCPSPLSTRVTAHVVKELVARHEVATRRGGEYPRAVLLAAKKLLAESLLAGHPRREASSIAMYVWYQTFAASPKIEATKMKEDKLHDAPYFVPATTIKGSPVKLQYMTGYSSKP
ncbi:hypothetical protein Dimus_024953, partial [Dionaea muscipula]